VNTTNAHAACPPGPGWPGAPWVVGFSANFLEKNSFNLLARWLPNRYCSHADFSPLFPLAMANGTDFQP